ncbi:YMGG-like glycine zipper-containing protein [Pelagibacterium luteolum]|uniref:Glycine zipper n=1 Tax=Pelagibacterium luteolum TaxID=440168 RepID=A0A1G7UHA5_9HYPH|nr:YMGG-like glycine zipper-containing protein [Pelagibacterium luteolum]SDG46936.1 Glycine zipper [Pelagibacterium luteolum]
MKKAFVIGLALTSLLAVSACTRTQETAAIGAGAGAVIGGVTTGSVQGAVVGGVVGGVAGALVGQVAGEPNQCYYRASDGTLYKDNCPRS